MSPYRIEHNIRTHDNTTAIWHARNHRKRSSINSVRENSLPRIEVIEDEIDTTANHSSCETEDNPDSPEDSESEDEASSAPSIQRSPTPRTDHLYPWPSYHDGPTLESQSPHTNLPGQRRTSSADSRSLAFVSVDVSRNNYGAPRRLSAPHIDSRSVPSDQGLPIETPPPKPPKPPLRLKLYPWMTQRESSPPRRTTPDDMIKCPYPTNGCTETLPKNMVVWRRHLTKKHGLVKDSVPQTCQWPGCTMTMGGRSLNRHVLMNHMDFKLSCPHCKVRRRYDHINKHILNCPSNPIGGASGG